MLNHTDLKKGAQFIYNDQPYVVLDYSLTFKGRGSSTASVKMKNLITGNTLSNTFHTGDVFQEAEIEKIQLKFLYKDNKDQFFFADPENPAKRTPLSAEQVGEVSKFLKTNSIVEGMVFNDEIVGINLPIKVQLKVEQAEPFLRAGRAEAGTKQITLETGAVIQAPVFIKEGDIVEINTETGEYSRRAE